MMKVVGMYIAGGLCVWPAHVLLLAEWCALAGGLVLTSPNDTSGPNCFECRHHFITHEPSRPYGCRRFGLLPFLPSRTVFGKLA